MKRLLLPTKIICICFLFVFQNLFAAKASEQQASPQQTKPAVEKKQSIKVKPLATDTARKINHTAVSGTVGNDKGTKNLKREKYLRNKAIIHNAPGQEKIDSIKNEKTKNKK